MTSLSCTWFSSCSFLALLSQTGWLQPALLPWFDEEFHKWEAATWASLAQTSGDLVAAVMMKVLRNDVDEVLQSRAKASVLELTGAR